MTEALKPCPNPWCDSTTIPTLGGYESGPWGVFCGCGLKAPLGRTPAMARTAWNTRSEGHAPERPMGELVELIRAWRDAGKRAEEYAMSSESSDFEASMSEGRAAGLSSCADDIEALIALTAPGGGGEGKVMASQGSAATIRGPSPVLPETPSFDEGGAVTVAAARRSSEKLNSYISRAIAGPQRSEAALSATDEPIPTPSDTGKGGS